MKKCSSTFSKYPSTPSRLEKIINLDSNEKFILHNLWSMKLYEISSKRRLLSDLSRIILSSYHKNEHSTVTFFLIPFRLAVRDQMPLRSSKGDKNYWPKLKNVQYSLFTYLQAHFVDIPSSCSADHHWLSALWFSSWCSPSGITHSRVTWLSVLCYYLFAKLCNLERYDVYLRHNRFTSTAVDKVAFESVKLRM